MSLSLDDSGFSALLQERIKDKDYKVLILANKFYAKMYLALCDDSSDWEEVGEGEIGNETREILKKFTKGKKLFFININVQDLSKISPDFNQAQVISKISQFDNWLKESRNLTTGRTGEITDTTKFKVACAAAWRCQFEGCGEDLRQHLTPSMSGNYSYFAHIVASSKEGPRGNDQSKDLTNDPNNIMLLCDKCHRLIDRIAPNEYDVETLTGMLERNVREVNRLLECLKMPDAEMMVIGGMIEGQPFRFDSRVAQEAMWLKNMKNSGQVEYFINNTSYFSASNKESYWTNAFELLKSTDIPRLKSFLRGTGRNGKLKPLAIFPLHGISILILSGRLIGDSSPVYLYQFHRQQVEGKGKQWAWPDIDEPPLDKFKINILKEASASDSEIILQVNLTAKIPLKDLPEQFFDQGELKFPAIELTIDNCDFKAISHQKDLELLSNAIDSIYRLIQDNWHIKTVHFFVIAPTTACMRLGQKMQARHHADFILYEREPRVGGVLGKFKPTIQISSTKVILMSNGEHIDIY